MKKTDRPNPAPPDNPNRDSLEIQTEIAVSDTAAAREALTHRPTPPSVPDHELLRCIGRGSYGEVWLARNVMGSYRAVKVVYRRAFEHDRPFEREFEGIRKFEPVSRTHESQVDILHVGRNDAAGYFYYVMELADDAGEDPKSECRNPKENRMPNDEPASTKLWTSSFRSASDFGFRI